MSELWNDELWMRISLFNASTVSIAYRNHQAIEIWMKRSHWRGLSLNLYGDFMALIGGNLRKSFSDGDNLWQIGLIYSMAFKMCWTQSWAFRCSRGPQKLFHWACLIDNIIEFVQIITIESTRLRNSINPALHLIRYIFHIIWSIRYIYGSY